MQQSYDAMPIGEIATFTFDFVNLKPAGVTITGVVCVALVFMAYGTSTTPAGMINTTATLNGTVASQLVTAVMEGVFALKFSATCSDGELIIGQAALPVAKFV